MKTIKYVGTSDIRTLGVDDVGKDLTFYRHEPQEVTNEVAKTILEHDSLVGEFEETDEAAVAPDAHIDDSINQGEPIPGL